MPNPNLELLELAAERLRQLLPEIVFVGGCATDREAPQTRDNPPTWRRRLNQQPSEQPPNDFGLSGFEKANSI
jgi:hypothetical protein